MGHHCARGQADAAIGGNASVARSSNK